MQVTFLFELVLGRHSWIGSVLVLNQSCRESVQYLVWTGIVLTTQGGRLGGGVPSKDDGSAIALLSNNLLCVVLFQYDPRE